ncbi:hypothetical protein PIB30_038027 [Stylosanthes scabra]|uniref:F-box associated beta-propeller type 3 domain-containing protein n=1 Tax=Stylosanthes scabra TaxID=79078 RepID=A0ABU6TDR3_9FABA|nr:hypothetical protein [Stylosanthes scabra]
MELLRRAFAPRLDCRDLLVYVHSFLNEVLTSYLRDFSLTSAFSIINDDSDTYSQPNGPFDEGDWFRFNDNSCHGLVFVTVDKFQGSLVLWNPTIRKFKILPQIKKYPMDGGSVHTGLGYDSSSDSYKVVEVLHSKGVDTSMVHIVGSDLWREIRNFSDFPPLNVKFINDIPNCVIVSFDMGRREFHEVPPPMNVIGDLNLSLLMHWLCIMTHRFMNSDVWVIKEYGKVESWTKFFNIPIYEENHHSHLFYNIIHCISEDYENGVMLLRNKSKFNVYDSKTETFNAPAVQKFQGYSDSKVIIEILVTS